MKLVLWVTSFVAVIFSNVAIASDGSSPAWTTVDFIYSPLVGRPFITFGEGSMPGCYNDRGGYFPVDKGEASQRVYSTILAAYMAKKDIKVYFNLNSVNSGYTGWGLCDIEAVNVH